MAELKYHLSYLIQILTLSAFWVCRLKRKPNFVGRAIACAFGLFGCAASISYLQFLLGASNWVVFSLPYFMILVLFGVALGICFDASTDVIFLTLLLPSTAQLCASAVGDVVYYLMKWTREQFYIRDIIAVITMCGLCAVLAKLYRRDIFCMSKQVNKPLEEALAYMCNLPKIYIEELELNKDIF